MANVRLLGERERQVEREERVGLIRAAAAPANGAFKLVSQVVRGLQITRPSVAPQEMGGQGRLLQDLATLPVNAAWITRRQPDLF